MVQVRPAYKRPDVPPVPRGLPGSPAAPHRRVLLSLGGVLLLSPLLAGRTIAAAATDGDSPDESAAVFSVVLPAVASLHGIPPAFFHSDVAVFNLSASRTTVVRATYRCTSDSCGSPLQTFAVAPRQLVLLEDVAGRLFGAPETSGAIEFSSSEPIVVTSRLYSPARPGPTLGMFVPGLGPDKAFVESELLNLSHSTDPAVGFRTNIGVFNPGDETRTAFVHCRDFRVRHLLRGNYVDANQECQRQRRQSDPAPEYRVEEQRPDR